MIVFLGGLEKRRKKKRVSFFSKDFFVFAAKNEQHKSYKEEIKSSSYPSGPDRLDRRHGLHPAGSPQAVPDHRLGAVHRDPLRLREDLAHGFHLRDVADECRRRVRVDVVDLLLLNARVLEGELDAGGDAEAVSARVGHVVGVAGDGAFFCSSFLFSNLKRVRDFFRFSLSLDLALSLSQKQKRKRKTQENQTLTSEVLAQDVGPALLRVLERLEHQHPGPLAHHEPVPPLVPRPRRALRLVAPRGQRAAGDKAAEAHGDDGGLGAADDHEVGVPGADVVGRGDEGVVGLLV